MKAVYQYAIFDSKGEKLATITNASSFKLRRLRQMVALANAEAVYPTAAKAIELGRVG